MNLAILSNIGYLAADLLLISAKICVGLVYLKILTYAEKAEFIKKKKQYIMKYNYNLKTTVFYFNVFKL